MRLPQKATLLRLGNTKNTFWFRFFLKKQSFDQLYSYVGTATIKFVADMLVEVKQFVMQKL